ncbi:zinc-binding alcohol dehydrogenase family protein [Actinoplanes sp. NPDC024001]|uniref:quinone oxidoreductase family protein n=1 Tax=Actinoplanes sp. NPDC024001 TaxID=3154598 RepID=UPI0033F2FA84
MRSRPVPIAGPGQVPIAVVAAPITPLDLLCASGSSYFGVPALPYVPGVQGVGHRPDGTPVWFATSAGMRPGDGSMAGAVAVPEVDVVPLPGNVPLTAVAALGLSAVAAHSALTRTGSLVEGEQVLVLGGGGVVGQSAIQLARLAGARRVIAVARSAVARDRALELGAAAAVPLDADDDVPTLAARLRAATDGPLDLVLDPVFGVPAAAALRVLRPGGRLVNLGGSAAPTAPFDSATLRAGSLRILGYTNNALTVAERAESLTVVAEHAAAGRLAVAHEVVPLEQVREGWERQAAGVAGGRVVLTV